MLCYEEELQALFQSLGATSDQLDYPTFYASARDGWITDDPLVALEIIEGDESAENHSMQNLLEAVLEHLPEPTVGVTSHEHLDKESFAMEPFALAAVTVGYDNFLGRTCTGKIYSGSLAVGEEVHVVGSSAAAATSLTGIFVNKGIERTPIPPPGVAYAGDIVTLAGIPDGMAVGETLTKVAHPVDSPLWTPPLAPAMLSMDFGANNGPLAGQEGTIVTASKVRQRLIAETDNNVTLQVSFQAGDTTTVQARGELQLGILIEEMRREGYELVISPPKILMKDDPDTGKTMEPFEEVTVDVDTEYAGTVVSCLTSDRKGVLLEMTENAADQKTRLVFEIPSRGLLGFSSEVATLTRGSAVVNHVYIEDRPFAGHLGTGLDKAKLISSESGKATAYALGSLASRGSLFVEPGDIVYPGMIVGENAKTGGSDLEVNPVRSKAATNMRTQNKDEKVFLAPPKRMTVEELIGYMSADEMIEVTPKSIRLRKAELDPTARKKAACVKKQQKEAQKK